MKSKFAVGVVLIVLGVLALVYQGVSYTTEDKIIDIGSLEVTEEDTHTLPLPPILGAVAIIGGAVLLAAGKK